MNLAKKKKQQSQRDLTAGLNETELSAPEIPRAPELKREPSITQKADETTYNNVLFISDAKMSPDIKSMLDGFTKITCFDEDLFKNRSCYQLWRDYDVANIWCNIADAECRKWIASELRKNEIYKVVVAYKGNKNQKWIDDLMKTDKVDTVCKITDLKKLKALSLDEFMGKFETMLEIHKPVSKILSVLGCGLTKEKK